MSDEFPELPVVATCEFKRTDVVYALFHNRIPDEMACGFVVINFDVDGQAYQALWPLIPLDFPTYESHNGPKRKPA